MSGPREPLPFRRPGVPGPAPGPRKRTTRARPAGRGIGLYVGLACAIALALMLAPSIQVPPEGPMIDRARSDCITIGSAILRFQADTGLAPRWFRAADANGTGTSRVMVIIGPGRMPRDAGSPGWTAEATDELNTQLTTNAPGYPLLGPGVTLGWNGPYLSPGQIEPDPWNNRYLVNVGLLEPRDGAAAGGRQAVWALSAGPNGAIDTPLRQEVGRAKLGGDDIAYRIQ